METLSTLNGTMYARMIHAGTENLRVHAQAINNLNVFPIPDGDTGDNMLLTMLGGSNAVASGTESVGETSRRVADGMLLSARGNSGVILSQFFDGIAHGFEGVEIADSEAIYKALRYGVEQSYNAVMEPTEGTILTVARKAVEYTCGRVAKDLPEILANFLKEAKRTLDKTPEMLPVLKKAGVVDSGGAGLIYIMEGMEKAMHDDKEYTPVGSYSAETGELDLNLFTENDVLEYGYCTELLLRLQKFKTDPETFEVSTITDYLKKIGDSVVAFKTGSIVKIHVHTMTPDKVMAFCQMYGEFLKIKIENMSLQHNNSTLDGINIAVKKEEERKPFGIVAVCAGEGIKQMFLDRGADVIVEGGQTMNPSTEDFLSAFDEVDADTIFVLPNNGNVVLAAKQAAGMYNGSDIRVIESATIGEGYSALSMFCADSGDIETIVQEMNDAMKGTVTAYVSKSCRDTAETHSGDYIGFVHKDILSNEPDRLSATRSLIDKLNMTNYDICILIYGKETNEQETKEIENYITSHHPGKEVYVMNGMQAIYDYVLILE